MWYCKNVNAFSDYQRKVFFGCMQFDCKLLYTKKIKSDNICNGQKKPTIFYLYRIGNDIERLKAFLKNILNRKLAKKKISHSKGEVTR
jgi:hypothetical protein